MTANDQIVLGVVDAIPRTMTEVACLAGLPRTSTSKALVRLVADGIVKRTLTSHPYRFWREDER